MNIVYVNGDSNFKTNKYFESLKNLRGKVIQNNKKEKLVNSLGERFGILINTVADCIPKEKNYSVGLIVKSNQEGTKFDFYWCRGLLLNNKIEGLGKAHNNSGLKICECLLVYDDLNKNDEFEDAMMSSTYQHQPESQDA